MSTDKDKTEFEYNHVPGDAEPARQHAEPQDYIPRTGGAKWGKIVLVVGLIVAGYIGYRYATKNDSTKTVKAPPAVSATVGTAGSGDAFQHYVKEELYPWLKNEAVPGLNEALRTQAVQSARITVLEADNARLKSLVSKWSATTGVMPSMNELRLAGFTAAILLIVAGLLVGIYFLSRRLIASAGRRSNLGSIDP